MTRPLPSLAELDDYASGAAFASDGEQEAFEAQLFEAAMRGEDPAGQYLALRDGIAHLVGRGTFGVTMTEAGAKAFRASGLKVAYIDVSAGEAVTVSRSSDVLLMRFELDLRGVERVDIELRSAGQLVKTIDDVEFEAGDGVIYMACEAEVALEAARANVQHRFVAVDGDQRRVLGEFRVQDVPITLVE